MLRPDEGHFRQSWLIKGESLALTGFQRVVAASARDWRIARLVFAGLQAAKRSQSQGHAGSLRTNGETMMSKTIKQDIALVAGALLVSLIVLGADLNLTDLAGAFFGAR